MFAQQKVKLCFIIGPMKDMARLTNFRDNVIKPILTPRGFDVHTPEEGGSGNVMDRVLLGLEQADILIADLTGNSPNVLYELGVYHSFGKPYILVKEEVPGVVTERTPFDVRENKYHVVRLNDVSLAIPQLTALLDELIAAIDKTEYFGNPVTDFYRAPVAEIPTAAGLFKNYKKNFLDVLLPDIYRKNFDTREYLFRITEEVGSEIHTWTKEERAGLTIQILVPEALSSTTHEFVRGLKNDDRWKFRSATFWAPAREFKISYATNEQGERVIVDIPRPGTTGIGTVCRPVHVLSSANGKGPPGMRAQGDSRMAVEASIITRRHP
jgi:hypothetical protein